LFNCCESVSQVVDDALKSAIGTKKKKSKRADDKFKKAIDMLRNHEKKCHSKEIVAKKMAAAEAKDKSSLTVRNRLKERLRVRQGLKRSLLRHVLILIPSRL
jgi:hypothetical protein